MSLVTPAELAAFMGIAVAGTMQSALDIAEQQISVALGMFEKDGLGLADRNVVKTFWVGMSARDLEVPTGPLAVINTLSIDGTAQTIGAGGILIRDPWSIRFDPTVGTEFVRGARINLDCDIGYVASSPGAGQVLIPASVKNAVLIQASGVYSNLAALATGQVKTGERIGDYSVTYQVSGSGESAVSPVISSVLGAIRRTPYVGA